MTISTSIRSFIPFAIAVAVVSAVGGSLTQTSVQGWYMGLAKPTWTPPPAVFGPVWTILYAMMAVAAWRVFRKDGWAGARKPLQLWGIQLVLNALWSGCFFALRNPLLGLIDIIFLLGFVIATTVSFWRRDRTAGLLMLPYALWGTFAMALNFSIWRLNP